MVSLLCNLSRIVMLCVLLVSILIIITIIIIIIIIIIIYFDGYIYIYIYYRNFAYFINQISSKKIHHGEEIAQ